MELFAFVREYMDEEVSMESAEEAERLMGWGCKFIMMDLKWEIFLKVH